MGRRLLVVESGVDQSVLANNPELVAGREVLPKESLRTFAGEKVEDAVYLCTSPEGFEDDTALFDDLLDKVMARSGSLAIKIVPPGDAGRAQAVARTLRLNGFVEVQVKEDGLICSKMDAVEVGFVQTLNLSGTTGEASGTNNAAWKISMDDEEYIDDSELLDEEDLARPDPASLKVCGTTGKRKACKDCSCGLAQELAAGGEGSNEAPVKSSCGSCYLGDAFRCASCPYLGTPPFKPGEKVTLSSEPDL